MSGPIDFAKINRAALAAFPAVLARILPSGKYVGSEYLALNPSRTDRHAGSFKVNIATGRWADFATSDKGGDPISLVAYLGNVSQGEGARMLARMLGMTDAPAGKAAQRLLVVEHEQQVLVFPVDEVAGVYGYAADAVQAPPSTMAHAGMTYTQSLIAWRDQQLGLLDFGLLFYALNRSLT